MRGKHDDNNLKLKAPGEREALEPLGVVSIVRDHTSHTTVGRLQERASNPLLSVTLLMLRGDDLCRKGSKVWVGEKAEAERNRPSIPLKCLPAKRIHCT